MAIAIPDSHTVPATDGGYPCSECGIEHTRLTKVIDTCVPKPALVPWAYRIGKEGGDIQAEKEAGGDRGTALHHYLSSYIITGTLGPLTDLDVEHRGYGQQLNQFIVDYEPEFHASEVLVVHHGLDYAGTLDGFVTIGKQPPRRNKPWDLTGKRVLFDLKTSRDGRVYTPAHFYQVSGYEHAWRDMGGEHSDDQVIVAVGEASYQLAVNYFLPSSFVPLVDYYNSLQTNKAFNPNAKKKG